MTENFLTVRELSRQIEESLNTQELNQVNVAGEIIDCKAHSSGHIYLTLADKDSARLPVMERAIIKCTLWRSTLQRIRPAFQLKSGMEVFIRGSIRVYHAGGTYNLNINAIEQLGLGDLIAKIERTRAKLIQEGLIDPARRRPIPVLPRRLGIVTAEGSAALEDIFRQIRERFPGFSTYVFPATMQGEAGIATIVRAIEEAGKEKWGVDVILLARGGGSFEDLAIFNDEAICRAVATSRIPIVSAIGHQTDTPLCDFVADLAASTPTDGARKIVPEKEVELERLNDVVEVMRHHLNRKVEMFTSRLQSVTSRTIWQMPDALFQGRYMMLQDIVSRMANAGTESFNQWKIRFRSLRDLDSLFGVALERKNTAFQNFKEKFLAFSPLQTLNRGFTLSYKNKALIRSVEELQREDKIQVQFKDGIAKARVSEIVRSTF